MPNRLVPGLVVLALALGGCAAPSASRDTQPVAGDPPAAAPAPLAAPAAAGAPTGPLPNGGQIKSIPAQANAATAHVAEAATTGRHPERLSPMIAPPPFSAAAYAQDPAPYLNSTEPGRVFQSAQPGPQVPVLVPAGATVLPVAPGQGVTLAVKAPASAPVSWLSTDLGAFPNGLVSITVAAGADGVARTVFTATPGTSGRVNVQAGCPLASGQVHFVVEVQATGLAPVTSASSPARR